MIRPDYPTNWFTYDYKQDSGKKDIARSAILHDQRIMGLKENPFGRRVYD
jgi:hypothetical protein